MTLPYKRVIFTADLLRVDDTNPDRVANPQRINVEWLARLFGQKVADAFHSELELITLNSIRNSINRVYLYRELDREFSYRGWASLYEDIANDIAADRIAGLFQNGLVVGFELPPWMIKLFNNHKIHYIDFCVHAVRFLPDYVLGVRTNNAAFRRHFDTISISDADVDVECAALCARAGRRLFHNPSPAPGSALFVGQMPVDSSLIADGRMLGWPDVLRGLHLASQTFSSVYYKAHPHRKDINDIKSRLAELHIPVIDMNIYDLLGSGRISCVFSLSSSVLTEARHFGVKAVRLSPRKSLFDPPDADGTSAYRAVYPAFMRNDFWLALARDEEPSPPKAVPALYNQIVKESLNMKWGR